MDGIYINILVESPHFFILLLFFPLLLLWGFRSQYELTAKQKTFSLLLRSSIFFCLLFSLVGLTVQLPKHKVALLYLIDYSDSINSDQLKGSLQKIRELTRQASSNDLVGLAIFAREPVLVQSFIPKDTFSISEKQIREAAKQIDRKRTNIEKALEFGISLFPPAYESKIVLFTDGRENQGKASRILELVKGRGIQLWTFGMPRKDSKNLETKIIDLEIFPSQSRLGEPIEGRLRIFSSQPTKGILKIFKQGLLKEKRTISLKKGINQGGNLTFKDILFEKGLHLYEVRLEVEKDKTPKNNLAYGIAYGSSRKMSVLIVEKEEEMARPLQEALEKENIRCRWLPPEGLGPNIYNYDALILSDVPVTDLASQDFSSDEIMALIKDYVRKGGGFIMLGGPNSFGLGGYIDTDIEKILPVEMDIPKKIELPTIAICLVIDKSGSMSGSKMELAKEASIKVVELLKPQDWIGVVGFDSHYYWAVPLRTASARNEIITKIRRIRAGGGTYIYPALYQAYIKLNQNREAKIKHIILLTDGRTQRANHKQLCQSIRGAGITLSTVAVGRGSDIVLLRNMARWGKGRFYYTENFNNIPRIFTQEAMKISKSTIVDEPFKPILGIPAPYLKGIDWDSAPELLSYVVTRPKKTAIVSLLAPHSDYPEGRPLLATWQVGLGRTAAFTSDAKNRWAALWMDWEGFGKFWGQVIRYIGRKKSHGQYQLEVMSLGEKVRFLVDGADDLGEYLNGKELFLEIHNFKKGEGKGKIQETLPLHQTGPGRYEAEIKGLPEGFYSASLREKGRPEDLQNAGFSSVPLQEYLEVGLDASKIRFLNPLGPPPKEEDKIWSLTNPDQSYSLILLWPYLIIISLFLLPLDIAVRRIRFGQKTEQLPALPMRWTEILIRSFGLLFGAALLGGGGGWLYYTMELPAFLWIGYHGVFISLANLLVALFLAIFGGYLGWKKILRGRMF